MKLGFEHAKSEQPHLEDNDIMNDFLEAFEHPSETASRSLIESIKKIEMELSNDYEIAISLPASPVVFRLRTISHCEPDFLIIKGIDAEGNPIHLVQHYTNTSILISSIKKIDAKPYRIGFNFNQDKE